MTTEQWLTSSNYRKRFQCSSHLCKFTELISSLGWGSFLWCPFDRSWLARSDVVWTLDRDSLCWYTGYSWHAFLTRRLSFLPLSESPESCYSLCFPISASFEDTRCEHLCFGEHALWRWRIPARKCASFKQSVNAALLKALIKSFSFFLPVDNFLSKYVQRFITRNWGDRY